MGRFQLWPTITGIDQAMKQLRQHDRMVRAFYDDPMTEVSGCPTGDFQEDFDRRERKILAWLADNAPEGSPEREMALSRLGKYMP